MQKVWALVLPENTGMLKLGRKLGFTMHYDRDAGAHRLTKGLADDRDGN
jgi:hypothetical protein